MSQANFLSQYLPIRDLEPNVDKLKRMNKDDMSEKLCIAPKAFKEAEQVIATQSDSIIVTIQNYYSSVQITKNYLRKKWNVPPTQ